MTTRVQGIRAEVRLGLEDGLPRPSAANLDVITTIPKRELERYMSSLSTAKLQSVEEAIRSAVGLES